MNTLKLSIITCFSILYSLTSYAEVKSNVSIEIGSFDSIPSEIDGGCCVFYKYPNKMRNKSYIMVNDLATTAYMMINRHLEEFTLVSNQKDVFWYKNKRFTLKVTINHGISDKKRPKMGLFCSYMTKRDLKHLISLYLQGE